MLQTTIDHCIPFAQLWALSFQLKVVSEVVSAALQAYNLHSIRESGHARPLMTNSNNQWFIALLLIMNAVVFMQITGFTNLKNGVTKIYQHEQSEHHREAHEET